MDPERINAALRDAPDTNCVRIGSAVLSATDSVFLQCFGDQSAVLVADDNTYAVAGGDVREVLRASGREVTGQIIFPGKPALYADFDTVLELEDRIRSLDGVPLVVGSGTLNDITKLAAYRLRRPYMVVATAASMDGYAAFGAAITKAGFKQTMSCPAPRAVIADIEVLARAPVEMHASGYGDLIGKVTAGADWILADTLEIEPIDPRAWSLVQDSLREWTGNPSLLHSGDRRMIEGLFEGLVLSGVAMQLIQSSRPASGIEHLFSHLWEMQAQGCGAPSVPHGFKVGMGTIAGTALYEELLEHDLSTITDLEIEERCRIWPSRSEMERSVLQAHDLPILAQHAIEESLAKYIDTSELHRRLTLLRERWPSIRARLADQLMPLRQIRDLLRAAECPTYLPDIGLDVPRLKASYTLARTIRRRYTVLDLVTETGMLDKLVNAIFTPTGRWSHAVSGSQHSVYDGYQTTHAGDEEDDSK
jgi:glycerol-1-phosphate dehydrogenase [NAD(P)+]